MSWRSMLLYIAREILCLQKYFGITLLYFALVVFKEDGLPRAISLMQKYFWYHAH
jgi:hypothetical protein